MYSNATQASPHVQPIEKQDAISRFETRLLSRAAYRGMATNQAENNYWQQIIWAPTEIKQCSWNALWNDVRYSQDAEEAWVFVTSCPRMDVPFWLLRAGCEKSVNLKGFVLDKNRALPPVPFWLSQWSLLLSCYFSLSSPAVLEHCQFLPPSFLMGAMSQKWQNFHDFSIKVICFSYMSDNSPPFTCFMSKIYIFSSF